MTRLGSFRVYRPIAEQLDVLYMTRLGSFRVYRPIAEQLVVLYMTRLGSAKLLLSISVRETAGANHRHDA
jgi:hypothetical protein